MRGGEKIHMSVRHSDHNQSRNMKRFIRWSECRAHKTSRETTEKMMYLPVSGGEKSGFLVLLAYRAQIGANNFEIGILPDIVSCHLKHAKMKICNWAE